MANNDRPDDVRTPGRDIGSDASRQANTSGSGRDTYRDNDDARGVAGPDQRDSVKGDSRFEARGDARENVGDNARGTDAHPTGPGGNDNTRHRSDTRDEYDADLARDNHRGREGDGMRAMANDTRAGMAGAAGIQGDFGEGGRQHARKGQAESPAERTHNEPRHKVQGHGRHDGK